LVFALLALSLPEAKAQMPITVEAAIDTALMNNLLVKNERLKAEYQKQLIKAGANLPQTNVIGEYGQINSALADNRFVINQNINFPTVYSNQKSVLREEWRSSMLNVAVKEAELTRNVSQVYYTLAFLYQKKKLLQQNDSLYSEFLKKANLRFAVGVSNILEKTTAETQRGQIAMQLNQLNADLDLLKAQFQLLLNTTTPMEPIVDDFKINRLEAIDTATLSYHPLIQLLQQQKLISIKNTQLEKSKLLPDLSFAYNNMTMRGAGADNKVYDGSTRFQSGQIGLGIPLFYGSQRAKINASKSIQKITEANYLVGLQQLNNEYQRAATQYMNFSKSVDYYEQTGLKNAALISETANKQFANGGINYLEWVMLTNQAISLRNDYLIAVNNLNESIIQLNYFISK
jgi:heavy metal efflux system protein